MMKVKYVQKPDVGTFYYVNSEGQFTHSFTKDTPEAGIAEEFGVKLKEGDDLATVLSAIGVSRVDTEVEPPAGGPWRWGGATWVLIPPTYKQARQTEYREELGPPPDQLDALYKGLSLLIPDLAKAGVLSAETVAALTPDKTAPADTPAGWLGKVQDIKARNPKP